MWIGNVNDIQIKIKLEENIDNCIILSGEALLNISLKSGTIKEILAKFDHTFNLQLTKISQNTTRTII